MKKHIFTQKRTLLFLILFTLFLFPTISIYANMSYSNILTEIGTDPSVVTTLDITPLRYSNTFCDNNMRNMGVFFTSIVAINCGLAFIFGIILTTLFHKNTTRSTQYYYSKLNYILIRY